MKSYLKMSKPELEEEFLKIKADYERILAKGLNLNMARGKPAFNQLDVSNGLFDLVNETSGFKSLDGTDCRNYGGLDGLDETKELFGKLFGMDKSRVIIGGSSSLNMMFDYIAQAMTHGTGGEAWLKQKDIKFICPVPGYDRHFGITEHFGIKMIPVENTPSGPDMDVIEELIKDESVKGMWCVPKYSNPEGITYSDEIVKRIAKMKPAAKDFRVMWDNAYAIHDLYDDGGDELLNVYKECEKYGNEDLVIMFASTSKITFPGSGIAAMAASDRNIEMIKSRLKYQTIGPDKINQLRHMRFIKNIDELKEHMKKHASYIRPKFEAVLKRFDNELSGLKIARWTNPRGGYFISLYVMSGCAKRVEKLCADAGVTLTKVGATYPYGKDEKDSNIRIAPTFPTLDEINEAAAVLCTAVKYSAIEKILGEK